MFNNKFKSSLFTFEISITITFLQHMILMYTRVKIIITQAPDGSTLNNIGIYFFPSAECTMYHVPSFVLYFVRLVRDSYFILLENTCATTIP